MAGSPTEFEVELAALRWPGVFISLCTPLTPGFWERSWWGAGSLAYTECPPEPGPVLVPWPGLPPVPLCSSHLGLGLPHLALGI